MMDWTNIQYLKEVLMKQCEFAKVKFEDVDFDSETWFYDTTCTIDQSNEFGEWVKNYLKTDSKARKQLMAYPNKSKRAIEKWLTWYNLMYGFRIKED